MKKTQQYFRPDEEQLRLLERWYAPKVEDKTEAQGTNNAMGVTPESVTSAAKAQAQVQARASAAASEQEELVGVDEPAVTAQQLEDIRQSAYEEGLVEGRQKGHEQGLLEGHEKGYEQGLNQGQSDGLEQGLAQAKEQIDAQIAALNGLIEQLPAPLSEQDGRLEHELVELALVLAANVLHHEVEINPEVVVKAVSEGIKAIGMSQPALQILLNPDDMEAVQLAWGEETLAKREWTLMADPSIGRGGCQIESSSSSVDMDLQQRIREVFDNFRAMPKPEPLDFEDE